MMDEDHEPSQATCKGKRDVEYEAGAAVSGNVKRIACSRPPQDCADAECGASGSTK